MTSVRTVSELPQPLQSIALKEALHEADEDTQPQVLELASAAAAKARAASAARNESATLARVLGIMRSATLRDMSRWALECDIVAHESDVARADSDASTREQKSAEAACLALSDRIRQAKLARTHVARMQSTAPHRLRCPALTEEQQTQCLHLFHCLKYGLPFLSDDEAAAARAGLLQFALRNGTVPRLVTVYEKTDAHVGHYAELRKQPEREDDLAPSVRNRCRSRDGRLVGKGAQASKGIVYKPKDGRNVYVPSKRHKRDVKDTESMIA